MYNAQNKITMQKPNFFIFLGTKDLVSIFLFETLMVRDQDLQKVVSKSTGLETFNIEFYSLYSRCTRKVYLQFWVLEIIKPEETGDKTI